MLLFALEDTLDFIFTPNPTLGSCRIGEYEDQNFHFIINSVDSSGKQSIARKLSGRKIRLTVELIDEEEEHDSVA